MAITRTRHRGRYLVAVLLLAALTLITLSARGSGNGALKSVRSGFHTVLAPVESGIHSGLRPIGNFFTGVFNYGAVESENQRLRQELASTQGNAAEAQYLKQQYQQLLGLEHLSFAENAKTVAAAVVDQPSSNFEQTLTIDKGTAEGLAVGQPVVSPAGLAGEISQVGRTSATVTLVTDPALTPAVSVPGSNVVCEVTGQGEGAPLKLTVIPTSAAVPRLKVGEKVSTSAVGGGTPAGLPVGTITSVDNHTGTGTPTAKVKPATPTTSLSYVDVLLWSGQ